MLRSFLLFTFLVGAVQANDIDLHLASLDGGLRDKIKKIREEKGASNWIKKETLLQSSLQVGEQKRTYSYYKPNKITNETGVIFVFHGGEGSLVSVVGGHTFSGGNFQGVFIAEKIVSKVNREACFAIAYF